MTTSSMSNLSYETGFRIWRGVLVRLLKYKKVLLIWFDAGKAFSQHFSKFCLNFVVSIPDLILKTKFWMTAFLMSKFNFETRFRTRRGVLAMQKWSYFFDLALGSYHSGIFPLFHCIEKDMNSNVSGADCYYVFVMVAFSPKARQALAY